MYDMYPWDENAAAPGEQSPRPPAPDRDDPTPLDAVQVALDRRDNGGKGAAAATEPTAGPTRQ